jgi:precorrin-6A/cobalt-precorrin-6A reductase
MGGLDMIALILGTSEGKNIVSMLNEFTEDLLISTATSYGGELLQNYKYKILNTKPLGPDALKEMLVTNGVTELIDASHPYAQEITKNAEEACRALNIEYIRYERPSVIKEFRGYDKLKEVADYEELGEKIRSIEEFHQDETVLLDTTGSKNIEKLKALGLKCRIIHRVLPTLEVMEKCFSLGIKVEDIVAVKGPIGYELNAGFIKNYGAKGLLLKDSGLQGGTEEKVRAAIDNDIYIFVLGRSKEQHERVFTREEDVVKYIKNKLEERGYIKWESFM